MKNKTKTLWIVLSVALLLTVSVGGTLAYILTQTDLVENTFTESYVKCSIHENTFDGNEKTNVRVKNDGNIDAYIRAAIVATWKDSVNGNVYGVTPVENQDYTIQCNTSDWTYNTLDGFWYYNSDVEPGDETQALIIMCKPFDGRTPEGYGLNVEILAQAIQKDGIGANNAQTAFANAKK